MAFSALKPRSRVMRASPHQSDQQVKEAFNLLLQQEEEEEQEEADGDSTDDAKNEIPHSKSFTCEDPPFKQLLSSNPASLSSCDPSAPLMQLPTFIAPQGLHSLWLPRDKDCAKTWFMKHDNKTRHLVPLCEKEPFTQSFVDTSLPSCDFHQRRTHSSNTCSMLQLKPKKLDPEHAHHIPKQKLQSFNKFGGKNNSIYDLVLDQMSPAHELGQEKKRHSSASTRDMLSRKDIATMRKNRFCDVQFPSWEDEVRQAMAKSSLSKRQSKEGCKGGTPGCGLQRSISVKEHGASALPPTLIMKPTDGHGHDDATICTEQAGAKLIHDTVSGGCTLLNKGATEERRMWKGFNVVKSPSEERWEEAAQDEERQEMRRRARSQSMRYDSNLRTSDLTGIGRCDGNVSYNDEDWAVYRRSGYISVRPRTSDVEASAACCSSLMGRSLSMRDTRMGLVMECAACGTTLHGGGGHLLCICSCCATARASSTQGTPLSNKKKLGGSGILRACRRLLGLGRKRASKQQLGS